MDATATLGQPRVLISRNSLLHNVRVLRGALSPQTRICAMIKANAYGHGAEIIADTLANFSSDSVEAPAVDALAVVTLDEAEALPHTPLPLLVLRPVENIYLGRQRQRLEQAIRAGWILSVTSASAAKDLGRIALASARRVSVQIMIDTGMARDGCDIDELDGIVAAIESQPALRLHGLSTHFASSEEKDNPLTLEQLGRFMAATAPHVARNPRLIRHAANSGAIFFSPQSHLDMVRPGVSLYGIDPTFRPCIDRPLRPILRWTAPLLSIRNMPAGGSVGYNQTWKAPRDTRIGLVPVGYADGYLRSFSNRAMMLLRGKAVPVVGRVSMDYATIDLGSLPDAAIGDEVTILDSDPVSPASVYRLAKLADTIPYEIFCHIGRRMIRVGVEPADSEVEREELRRIA